MANLKPFKYWGTTVIRVKRGNLLFRQTSYGLWFYHRYDQKIPLAIKIFNNLENAIKDSERVK